MIRYVFIGALVCFLAALFYLPSRYPASQFLDQLRVEHDAAIGFWGEDHAYRVLWRTLELEGSANAVPPSPTPQPGPVGVDGIAAQRLAEASNKLFDNEYTRSIEAALTLFCYRLSSAVEVLPLSIPLILVCVMDGFVMRWVRSKQFVAHNPELFAAYGVLIVICLCGMLLIDLLPLTVHPLICFFPFAFVGLFGNQAVANYHVIG